MKILCVIDNLGSGGAQRQMVELAKGFQRYSHEVSFLVYHESNFYVSTLVEMNIHVETITGTGYLTRLIKMRRYIRNINADVVVSFLDAANFICCVSGIPRKKWKLVVGERSANPGMLKSFRQHFYKAFYILSDFVISNSQSNMTMVKKINPFLSNRKCNVIYNVVDEDTWVDKRGTKYSNNSHFSLVVVASHQYLKNAAGLIHAVNFLSLPDKQRLKVSWYGAKSPDNSYDEANTLVNQYNLNDIISFYPETKMIKGHILAADALGLFSLYEGLPNVVCEAMMLGKPVISSRVSDIPLFLTDDLTFDPLDSVEISLVISRIINTSPDDLKCIGLANKQKAMSLFNKTKILQSYLNLFKS